MRKPDRPAHAFTATPSSAFIASRAHDRPALSEAELERALDDLAEIVEVICTHPAALRGSRG